MNNFKKKIDAWAHNNISGILIFNCLLMLLVLLNTAGYFHPFLPLSISLIFFIALVSSAVFIKLGSKAMFVIALSFCVLAAFLKIVKVDIWAERTGVYVFEALIVGLVLYLFDR